MSFGVPGMPGGDMVPGYDFVGNIETDTKIKSTNFIPDSNTTSSVEIVEHDPIPDTDLDGTPSDPFGIFDDYITTGSASCKKEKKSVTHPVGLKSDKDNLHSEKSEKPKEESKSIGSKRKGGKTRKVLTLDLKLNIICFFK